MENETKELTPADVEQPQLLSRQTALIATPTPKEHIKERRGRGGQMLKYVATPYIIEKLNQIFGHAWSQEIELVSPWELAAKSGQLAVKVRLSVHLPDGKQIIKEQFGSSEVKFYGQDHFRKGEVIDIADDLKAAASDGLKKCASLFGIAADVYSGGYGARESYEDTSNAGGNRPVSNKPAPGAWQAKPATEKQINFVKSLFEKRKIRMNDFDNFLLQTFNKDSLSQLKAGDIDAVIKWIQSYIPESSSS